MHDNDNIPLRRRFAVNCLVGFVTLSAYAFVLFMTVA